MTEERATTTPDANRRPPDFAGIAARLLALANRIDPGLESISLGRDRAKHKRINDHAVAYGIRMALDELGLMPDDDE